MRVLMSILLALAGTTGCVAQGAPADGGRVVASSLDEVAERTIIVDQVDGAIKRRDFAALGRMERELRTSRARTPSGVWQLGVYHQALDHFLSDGMTKEEGCAYRQSAFVRDWARAAPDSPAPIVTQASLLATQAWCLRGGGYASSVPQEVWPRFHALIDQAHALLVRHKAMASVDPAYYAVLVQLLQARGVSKEAFMAVVDEAADREPYYYDTYFAAVHYFLPQWHGSWPELDRFARYAAERTATSDRDGVYARIHWALDECECNYLDDHADRAMLKKAMGDVYARYPVPWNAKKFAEIACRIGDLDEGRRYLRAMYPDAKDDNAIAAPLATCAMQAARARG